VSISPLSARSPSNTVAQPISISGSLGNKKVWYYSKPVIIITALLCIGLLGVITLGITGVTGLFGSVSILERQLFIMTIVVGGITLTGTCICVSIILVKARRLKNAITSEKPLSSPERVHLPKNSSYTSVKKAAEEAAQISFFFVKTLKIMLLKLPNQAVKSTNSSYLLWYNAAGNTIHLQHQEDFHAVPYRHDNKLTINLDKSGKVASIEVCKTKQDKIPTAFLEPLTHYFKLALQGTSSYVPEWTKKGAVLVIKLVRQGLSEIPLFHLKQFYKGIQKHNDMGAINPRLFVIFLKEDWDNAQGVDGGGISRDYLDEICKSIVQSSDLKFHKIDATSRFIPRTHGNYANNRQMPILTNKDAKAYLYLGGLFMYCYHSGTSSDQWDQICMTGLYFDDALFKAVLCLKAHEIDQPFGNLSIATKMKMCKALASAHEEKIYVEWIVLTEKSNLTDAELLTAAQIAHNAECLPDDLINEDEPDAAAIKQNSQRVKQALQEAILYVHGKKGQFGTQLAPIHAIAQGMLSLCASDDKNATWDNLFFNKDFRAFSKKIQGAVSRNEIVNNLELAVSLSGKEKKEILKKIRWLREWILNDASDEEVRTFLKFATGSPSLPKDQKIKVINQIPDISKGETKPLPVPKAQTCFLQIQLAAIPAGCVEGYNDHTKAAFIQCLKECALTDPGAYSTN